MDIIMKIYNINFVYDMADNTKIEAVSIQFDMTIKDPSLRNGYTSLSGNQAIKFEEYILNADPVKLKAVILAKVKNYLSTANLV
ncbi:hypothetical protein vBBak6_018 [Bacillus phage v_B-Bak6]|uniref:Uncharacterized protein n=2 Tax=Basiliskvirus TaxID=3044670 RepID=A0A385IK87_9CAUD|nr:hypothetical protein PP653_gp026 [Bacillus phage Basilisk]YP_010656933.1 hypothetical protein PP654_gp024 [Bacillus phage v_B-Bak10]AXY82980.1 hypothetical protein vBBak1_018 [Bacillus phage v_B-Bak1]AXY83100.1 hypothetical protein vBBak6_018 [Bacillus phage v_B-Bak6]AGR46689.1 hypothetical protein BASILISK_26 [Bacillus phage Basilisk]AXY83282.1 hypothetical protein vBBBak10_024 [Bacillus phage v_B-Bak10]